MSERVGAIQAVCSGVNGCGCGWKSEKYPFGLPGEENEDQARLSAVVETRLGHVSETTNCREGKLVSHCVEYRVVVR